MVHSHDQIFADIVGIFIPDVVSVRNDIHCFSRFTFTVKNEIFLKNTGRQTC